MEYHFFLIYQKLTLQDFNFQLFGILRVSTFRFDGSLLLLITFYSKVSGPGVPRKLSNIMDSTRYFYCEKCSL